MNEVEAKLVEIRNRSLQSQEAPKEVPVEEPSNSVTPTEAQSKPEAQVEQTEQPKEEFQEPPKEEIVSWDDSPEEESIKDSSPQIDFSELGSALELGEIKTKEDLITKTSELKSKLKELQEAPLAGISDELKEVIEVTKNGGDWKEYLAQLTVDYSKLDPVILYEEEFYRDAVKNPRYQTDGRYDQEKADAALDAIPEVLKEQYGKQYIYTATQNQRFKMQELKQRAEARKAQAETALSKATKNLGELLPVEKYGIKFEPKHSSDIYNGIVSSKLTKKHLGASYEDLVKIGADMNAVVRSITMAEKGEKMLAFKSSSSKVEAKKEILKSTQNVQLSTPGSVVTPEDPEKRTLTPAEKLRQYLAQQKKGL